jgi:hypothetical protein
VPYRNFSDEELLTRLQHYASELDYELFEERRGRLWHVGFYAGEPMSVERFGVSGRTHREAIEDLLGAAEGIHGPPRPHAPSTSTLSAP